ncbi:MAG: AAA family ATPase [Desulfobacteraceae bacterium]|nr:AAA family ATPase [Desulfobacteraceae bacterium]
MYTEFYGFKEKPFHLVPNPAYLYLSPRHQNALTYLEYGLAEKVGFIMLTGEIGMGKTTLVRHILNDIESDMDVAVIFNTNVLSDDLISLILTEFEIKHDQQMTKAKSLELLYKFLIDKYAKGRKVLLIIDEAQNLSDELLEEIRMLSNLQTDEDMLLQIMIVGQPELREKIESPRLEQFAQRIAVSYHLSPMDKDETHGYIAHRLKKAGGREDIFDDSAVEIVFENSAGIPRRVNLLCDAALVYGFADNAETVTGSIVSQVIQDKGGMGIVDSRNAPILLTDIVDETPGGKGETDPDLPGRLSAVENSIARLQAQMTFQVENLEKREKDAKDQLIVKLHRMLAAERKISMKLTYDYGRLKEKYLDLINKSK